MRSVVLIEADVPKTLFQGRRVGVPDVEEHELRFAQVSGRQDLRLLTGAHHHGHRVEALGGEELLLRLDAAVVVVAAEQVVVPVVAGSVVGVGVAACVVVVVGLGDERLLLVTG